VIFRTIFFHLYYLYFQNSCCYQNIFFNCNLNVSQFSFYSVKLTLVPFTIVTFRKYLNSKNIYSEEVKGLGYVIHILPREKNVCD
jgi:hypothetical protein